jgi:hypothetical protein
MDGSNKRAGFAYNASPAFLLLGIANERRHMIKDVKGKKRSFCCRISFRILLWLCKRKRILKQRPKWPVEAQNGINCLF